MDLYEAIETICKDYCKYPDIESGNRLADICDKCPMNKCEDLRWANHKTEPQRDFGEYADRLWKIAYERGKREALEQTKPSCNTCKFKDTTEWCKRQEVCRAYQPKDESQTIYYPQVDGITPSVIVKNEPQTDGYMNAEQTADYRKMFDNAEHKVYGNIFEDKPQTLEDAILYYENLAVQNHSEYYEQLSQWLLELRMHKAIKNINEQSGKE